MDDTAARRRIATAAVLGATLALVGRAAPPLHLPTHELIQGIAAGMFLVGPFLVARIEGDRPTALVRGVGTAVAFVVGLSVVHGAANLGAAGCRVEDAVAFTWITLLPVALLASVIGVLTRGWSPWKRGLLLFGLAALSGGHYGLQYLNGVRIVDPILGDPLAFNQRTSMAVPPLHTWQRLWLVAVALSAWGLAEARRTGRWRLGGLATVLAAGLTFGAGSHIGVGWGRAALRSHLDAELVTEHFRILYPSTGRSAVHVAASRAMLWN